MELIEIRYGYSCRLEATLLDRFGDAVSLIGCKGISAVLVTPEGAAVPLLNNVRYHERRNVIKALVTARELNAVGTWRIVFNVRTAGGMMASAVTPFAEVTEDCDTAATADVSLDMELHAVAFPESVRLSGASPKIGPNNTWLVYDDSIKAFVDTGIEVGYAALISRYDAKYAEILQPAVAATVKATEAASAANDAADTATDAANAVKDNTDAIAEAAQTAKDAKDAVESANTALKNISAKVEQTDTGAKVTVTDKDGTETEADISNGVVDEGTQQSIAEADNNLDRRIASLEDKVASLLSGKLIAQSLATRNLDVYGTSSLLKRGDGEPEFPPDFVPQFYYDTTGKRYYRAVGTESVNDWEIVEKDDATAQSLCSLAARLSSLESLFVGLISGSLVVDSLTVRKLSVYGENTLLKCGSGAPEFAPDFIAQIYCDTAAKVCYFAVGTDSVSDWVTF